MLKDYFQQLQLQRHRGLLVVSGTVDSTHNWATSFLEQNNNHASYLWLSDDNSVSQTIHYSSLRNIKQYLGTECHILVFDAHSGFPPNSFCAAADTVVGGGVILLLTPPLSDWANSTDKNFSAAYETQAAPRHFIQRVINYLHQAQQKNTFIRFIQVDNETLPDVAGLYESPFFSSLISINEGKVIDEQQDIIQKILKTIHGRAHRPLLISASRGRGKSAALGMALSEWLKSSASGRIILSGADWNSVATAFSWAGKQLEKKLVQQNELCVGNAVVEYIPIDKIIAEQPAADALVIDEAAAIPLPMLQKLLQHYARIVFVTTTIGYEGSGRGFSLRFTRILDGYSAQWRRARLIQPIRWAADDPMEKWLNKCFLLADHDAEVKADNSWSILKDDVKNHLLSHDDLAADEMLLSSLFRLLVNAHYRTEPDDLRYLLDAPDVKIFASFCNDKLIAAALIAKEYPLAQNSIERIRTQTHRPRGHVLSQTLALQEGIYDGLLLSAWRIVRVAVQPELQRYGFGTKLLDHIIQSAKDANIDYLGSSFSIDAQVFAFWRQSGFSLLRIGLHRDHAAASYAALVMMPFSEAAKNLQQRAQTRFVRKFPQLLPHYWCDLEPELVANLMSHLPVVQIPSSVDVQQFNDYVRAAISYDAAWLSLSGLLIWRLSMNLSQEDRDLLELPIRRILQCWSWDKLVQTGTYSGRKTIEKHLRESLALLFADELPRLSIQ